MLCAGSRDKPRDVYDIHICARAPTVRTWRGGGPSARSVGDVLCVSGAFQAWASPPNSSEDLFGADDLEVLVHEDVVRPVDADHVDVVVAAAQQDHTVDGASRVRGDRGGFRLVCSRPRDDRA